MGDLTKFDKGTNNFLSVADLAEIIDISKRGIRQLVERDNIPNKYYRYVPGKGRGGKQLQINPLGLPDPYKMQFMQHRESQQIQKHERGTQLPEWALEYAKARLDILHLLQRELRRAKDEGRNITPVYDETADMYNSGHVLENAFEVIGKISGYTLQQRWWPTYKKARKEGKDVIEALAPEYNTNKGRRSVPDWYRKRLKSVLLHPNQIQPARAIKIVNTNLRREGKEIPCSERTAQRWVKDFKNEHHDRWVLMREGQKALNDKVLPYLERDWNLLDVGQVLIADGHVLNFDVKHPQTGKAHRPILICFYDGRSRMPVGISIMPTENTDNISEALADAVRTLGKFPDAVILDNGRAFKAKYFTESPDFDDSGLGGIYERYGILTHFTLPYHGQSKPIEPFFMQLNERFSKMLPTYRGSSINKKVPRLKRNEKLHQKAYDEQVGDWLPTIPQTVKAIKHWSWNAYGESDHGGLRKGETPKSVLQAGKGPGVQWHEMFDLLLDAKAVKPRRGRIQLEGIVYQNWDALTGINYKVTVRYTRRVPEKIWVFDTRGERPEFMCIAQAVEAVHPLQKLTNEEGDFDPTIRERLKQRKKLEKRARRNTEELRKLNGDIAEPVGNLTAGDEDVDDYDIYALPDATPNEREDAVEIEPMEVDMDEDDGELLFEHPYERFEHIADKEANEITDDDIAFVAEFAESSVYEDLYEAQHAEWVNELINNN